VQGVMCIRAARSGAINSRHCDCACSDAAGWLLESMSRALSVWGSANDASWTKNRQRQTCTAWFSLPFIIHVET
jgi:hypothetical protein